MKRFLKFIIIVFCALFIFGGAKVLIYFRDNKIPNFTTTSTIYIYPQTTANQAIDLIIEKSGVKSINSLKRTFRKKKVEENIQPGAYTIEPSYSSVYVARMLNNAWQTPVKLVLEGTMRSHESIARRISAQMMIDSISVHKALHDEELLYKFGHDTTNSFSLFYPATYDIYWTDDIETILSKQKQALDAYWTEERLSAAKKLGLTIQEVSILASIVKGETNYEPEMPKIAGVYLNRLAVGMKLQADPTVAYCLDYKTNRILKRDLQIDSPYNTYKNLGLPPGPIMVPTKACLDAVLYPDYGADTRGSKGNLYFCASPLLDGTHLFAKSYSAHLKNARAFQKAISNR